MTQMSEQPDSLPHRSLLQRSGDEDGVALMTALVIMVMVGGLMTLVMIAGMGQVDATRDNAEGMRSVAWLQAASDDLAARLDTMSIGATMQNGNGREMYLDVPTGGAGVTYAGGAFQLNAGGQGGSYRILHPDNAQPGTAANIGAYWTDTGSSPERLGQVRFVLEGWATDSPSARSKTVEVVFVKDTLARFAVLSNDPIDIVNAGGMSLAGQVHSNNLPGRPNAIVATGGALGGVDRVSATTGGIVGCSTTCIPNSRDSIDLASADQAAAKVTRIANQLGGCAAQACHIQMPNRTSPGQIPVFEVSINTPCIGVQTAFWTVEENGPPIINDGKLMSGAWSTANGQANLANYCPGTGGGAIVLGGDVLISGTRGAGLPPVTIFARRPTDGSFPDVAATATQPQRPVTQSASIWITGSTGSVNPTRPLGLVAQGAIYFPSSYMGGNVTVNNAALLAKQDEIAVGPKILEIAADSVAADGTFTTGGGLDPCEADGVKDLPGIGYFQGGNLTLNAAVITSRMPVFRYGDNSCGYVGFNSRSITYPEPLASISPPFFPQDVPWHVARWQEFAA